MKEISMKWNSVVEDGNPEKSGDYITLTRFGNVIELGYSNQHDMWNVYDGCSQEHCEECEIKVLYWASYGEVFKELYETEAATDESN